MELLMDNNSKALLPVKEECSNTSVVIKVETVIEEEKCKEIQDSQSMSFCLTTRNPEEISDADVSPQCKKETPWENIHPASSKSHKNNIEISEKFIDVFPGKSNVETNETPENICHLTVAPPVDSKPPSSTGSVMTSQLLTASPESEIRCAEQKGEEYHSHRIKSTCLRKSHVCNICNKPFTRPSLLERHMRNHTGERPYGCDFCKKAFTCKKSLKCHMKVHTGERPYVCGICKKSFVHKCRLKAHTNRHLGTVEGSRECPNNSKKSTCLQKLHVCNICNKSFTCPSHLERHMRKHTGERPYVCDLCIKAFTCKKNLTEHMKVHTGERPHVCDICKKAFARTGTLNRHMRVHTRDKPHVCDICNKVFAREGNLQTHKSKHLDLSIITYVIEGKH